MKRLLILCLTLLMPSILFASEKSSGLAHVPSIKDLIWPAFNFFVLFGALVWKLKKPISDYFTNYAIKIQSSYESATNKYKEANVKYELYEKKLNDVERESEKIIADAHHDAEEYRKRMSEETKSTFAKIQVDSERKLESERDALVYAMKEELVNSVIMSVRKDVRDHKDHQHKVTGNLLSNVR